MGGVKVLALSNVNVDAPATQARWTGYAPDPFWDSFLLCIIPPNKAAPIGRGGHDPVSTNHALAPYEGQLTCRRRSEGLWGERPTLSVMETSAADSVGHMAKADIVLATSAIFYAPC